MNVFIGPGKAEGRSSLEGALLVQVVQLMNIRLLCLMISDYFTGFTCFLQGVHVSDTWYVSWFLNCYFISCLRRAICFFRSCLMFLFFFTRSITLFIYKGSAWVRALAETNAPGGARQHFDLFDSIPLPVYACRM